MKTFQEFVSSTNQDDLRKRLLAILKSYPWGILIMANKIHISPKILKEFIEDGEDVKFKQLAHIERFVEEQENK